MRQAPHRFPLPAIALRGDVDELHIPLSEIGTDHFKSRAGQKHKRQGEKVWGLSGDSIELRNPEWLVFLEETLTMNRATLGISQAAHVMMPLRNMTLVESGAHLEVKRERAVGVFGTLVIVMPSVFEGSDVVIQDDDEKVTWQTSGRDYGISYGFFHNACVFDVGTVTSGAALYLVYDLVTTTPAEVPSYAGPDAVQHAVNEVLADYFDAIPAPLAKILKISPDARRTANEFAVERPFVYIAEASSFDDLNEDDCKIARSLQAFCAQSGSQFVLYLARIVGAQGFTDDEYEDLDLEDGHVGDMRVAVMEPWLKQGEAVPVRYPPILLRHGEEVAPLGRIDNLPQSDLRFSFTFPYPSVLGRLRSNRSKSTSRTFDTDWTEFFEILVKIDDCQLFNEMLSSMKFDRDKQSNALHEGIRHFSWDTRVDTLVRRILSTPTLFDRVTVIASVVFDGLDGININPLLEALLSLHPWTKATVNPRDMEENVRETLNVVHRLLEVVIQQAPDRFEEIVMVPRREEMLSVSLMALTSFVFLHGPVELSWWPVFHRILDHAKHTVDDVEREMYTSIRIPMHCHKCSELQTFLTSQATETTMRFAGTGQREHIEQVKKGAIENLKVNVELRSAGTSAVHLEKKRDNSFRSPSQQVRYLTKRFARTDRAFFTDQVSEVDDSREP